MDGRRRTMDDERWCERFFAWEGGMWNTEVACMGGKKRLDEMWRAIRSGFGSLFGGSSVGRGRSADWEFAEEVMRQYHFTAGAQAWLRNNANLRVDDLGSTRGGGYWMRSTREVGLFT